MLFSAEKILTFTWLAWLSYTMSKYWGPGAPAPLMPQLMPRSANLTFEKILLSPAPVSAKFVLLWFRFWLTRPDKTDKETETAVRRACK